ncbi:hypothetical protein L1987_32230 [Smallanthus sonchifolius]|uniref:Uncharacterized protein n=1 Tax=Smallanthus sonchifolius TaxID=185202 RepID=A0ACB9I8D8_9ASTR|nr:hypothetical protein L1987_32230 [Smallanthus sonchifolius]
MAGSSPPSSNSPVPTKPPKSKFILTRNFFSKSLIIILVLLVFFFFPSQVPEMFKETTIVTKLWELIYLLVIGIAACYGLFSRKIDSVHSSDESSAHADDTYLSGISHISSIFEDGVQNSYGFEEKSLFEGFKGSGSRFSGIGDGFGKKMNQCFVGESLVVINDESYVLEQLGRQNKPNLGSKSLESGAGKSVVVEDSCSSGWEWDDAENGKFRGVMPVKLEEKFKETDSDSDTDIGSRTPLSWRSKSMRLEKREDPFAAEANEASHFRPLSVGDLDFKGLKSQPVRSGIPSKINNLLEQEEFKGVEPNSRYKKRYLNNETSFMESRPQESSTGSFSEMNNRGTEVVRDFNGTLEGNFEEVMKDFGKVKDADDTFDSRNNAQFVRSKSQSSSIGASSERNMESFKNMLRKEEKTDISNSIPKPATIANTYRRGKSVRTNRSKEQVLESKVKKSQTDDKVETTSKTRIDAVNVKADELSDTEPHSGEVDRKAEEFIAKFREQIRLQKVASARKLNLL